MKLTLCTITNDESGEHLCDWAILHLTPATIETINRRILQGLLLAQADNSFFEVEFFDSSIQFCAYSDEIDESLLPIPNLSNIWQIEGDISITPTITETPTIVISNSGIHWATDTKCGVHVETVEILFTDFEQLIREVQS